MTRPAPLHAATLALLALASACVPADLTDPPEVEDMGADAAMNNTTGQDMGGGNNTTTPDLGNDMAEDMGGALINPFDGDAQAAMSGQARFEAACTTCHDAAGGVGAVAMKALSETATDADDAYIFTTIKDGQDATAMPSYGAMYSDDEIWELVTFIRTLAP